MDYNQQLLRAAEDGDVEQLKDAIDNGADLDARDDEGMTAAMATALNGHTECLAMLIEAGVDLDAKDKDGWTAAMWAAVNGHTECLKMLIGAGADLKAKDDDGYTAAIGAAGFGRAECLVLLIQAGIDPTKETLNDKTLLEFAQDKGWEDVISAWENQVMLKKVGQRTSREEGDSFGL